jgi:gas vesicle protein
MSNKTFWIAFLTGLTAGSVVALLYAPQSGEETRKKLGKAYDDAEDYVEDASDYLKDQTVRLTAEANAAYKKGVKQLDEAYSNATDALTTAYSEAKEKLASVADDALDQVEATTKKVRSLV